MHDGQPFPGNLGYFLQFPNATPLLSAFSYRLNMWEEQSRSRGSRMNHWDGHFWDGQRPFFLFCLVLFFVKNTDFAVGWTGYCGGEGGHARKFFGRCYENNYKGTLCGGPWVMVKLHHRNFTVRNYSPLTDTNGCFSGSNAWTNCAYKRLIAEVLTRSVHVSLTQFNPDSSRIGVKLPPARPSRGLAPPVFYT